MTILVLISAVIMLSYLSVMGFKYGVKKFVSDNYYIGRQSWLFSFVIGVVGALLLPPMLEKGGNFGFLALFAVFGLMLVAVEPHYKIEKMHSIGALMALICGVLWVMSFKPILVAFAVVFWFGYKVLKFPKPYYVGEVLAFLLIYISLLL
jgi:hypothetical protein|nr:MAG TPA: hypothetical protein [Caudoviricetes sp.]